MSVRLVVTITAAPAKGAELAQAMRARCEECMKEPGCEQFEIFQSALNPDKLALLERWSDQAALDTHAKLNSTRPALRPELRVGSGEREDYQYNRTREPRRAQCLIRSSLGPSQGYRAARRLPISVLPAARSLLLARRAVCSPSAHRELSTPAIRSSYRAVSIRTSIAVCRSRFPGAMRI